jgi:hypothetical protein
MTVSGQRQSVLWPDLYEAQFNVDGLMIADPGSSMPKPQRGVNTSLL